MKISPAQRAKSTPATAKATAKVTAPATPPPPADQVVDMDEAIRVLKTSRPSFYRWLREGKIKGMKVGRQWRFYRADLARFLEGEGPRIALPVSLQPLLAALSARLGQPVPPVPAEPAAQVVAAVNLMIVLAHHLHASDVHLAPNLPADGGPATVLLRYRIDGVLQVLAEMDLRLLPAVVEQWKRLSGCNAEETARPQDGRSRLRLPTMDQELDLRVCFIPTALGEAVTVRVLQRAAAMVKLDQYHFTPMAREQLDRALRAAYGLVLITGPTGSGKTTTLYAALAEVTKPEVKVVSVEDPVEYLLPGVVQTAVNHGIGLTFSTALRAQLRSDPDVIMIGELRDRETLHMAINATLTGHLVLTTMHTSTAIGALQRLVDIGAEPFMIADAVRLIVGQRLVRRVCPACSRVTPATAAQLAAASALAPGEPLPWTTPPASFRVAVGCPECRQTGFRGRRAITEMLELSPALAAGLRQGADPASLRALALRHGFVTLEQDALRLAELGVTTLEEACRVMAAH